MTKGLDQAVDAGDAEKLRAIVREARIVVCCGAGGVGKTTTSGALALAAASLGRKVLVLTIDPSKRLAETLGVSRNPPKPVPVELERLGLAGRGASAGSLDAWMLDPKLIADEAVRRIVRNPTEVEKLLQNRIYQSVTTMVAGMHEYTAMQALHRFVEENRYDLVVLDTPPSRHALDFLEAPGRLSRFLDGRVFRMFMPSEQGSSAFGGLKRAAGGLVHRVLNGVLGPEFSSDLTVFFGVFAGVLGTISRDVTGMREFLSRPEVSFLLISSPAAAALEEALFFQDKTRELKLPFRGFLLNRSHAADAERAFPDAAGLSPSGGELSPAARSGLEKLGRLAAAERELITRDQKLLGDLKRRAGEGGFAVALPTLSFAPAADGGRDELAALGMLAKRILGTAH
ncbi:MAG: ArsA family ATPase [Deltaproteobacteria bacterium]|nr:ArsA family ATPase [Deltaproteobacteria bacterium]